MPAHIPHISLSGLRRLYLSSNDLTGEIPEELGSLSGLRRLYLSSNDLTGEVPEELGALTNLDQLVLSSNRLTGAIPDALENWDGHNAPRGDLEWLVLGDAAFNEYWTARYRLLVLGSFRLNCNTWYLPTET